jgi:hypothetical protein
MGRSRPGGKGVTANRRHWWLHGLAVAIISLHAMAPALAEPGPNTPNMQIRPAIVHPGRFAGPDSVRFPTRPEPVIAVDTTSTGDIVTTRRRGRKQTGKAK